MKQFIEKLSDPDFGDKLVFYTCLIGFGFVLGMIVTENACLKGML